MIGELLIEHGAADTLLRHYGFQRHGSSDPARPLVYVRDTGPIGMRYWLRADGTAALEIGLVHLHEDTGVQGIQWRPFNTPESGDATLGVALDAAWFVATVEGLTPPIVGGRMVFEREPR